MNPRERDTSAWYVIGAVAVLTILYAAWQLGSLGASAGPAVAHTIAHVPEGAAHHAAAETHHAVEAPAMFSILPFAALLLCIAVFPLLHRTSHWWEHNSNKFLVAGGFALLTLAYYALLYGHGVENHLAHGTSEPGLDAAWTVLQNALLVEYVPFIVLLFSLYVISGGIAIEGTLIGSPTLNTRIIGIGAVLASFIGTTGAAMLLIRPLLRANARRQYVAHTVVFFIFVVCNTGGCLLPIGDPPLFLGYLRGVPFFWTLELWKEWLFMNGLLLAVYYAWDQVLCRREPRSAFERTTAAPEPFAIRGALNFAWLVGVIAAVAILDPSKPVPGTHWTAPIYFREIVLLILTALSLGLTPASVRTANSFGYEAILEVAALFVGIFVCMQCPIQILNVHGAALGIDAPWKFYWATGALSSFLDNAPTYVVFFTTAQALPGDGLRIAGVSALELAAVSLGAVFMGSMTYIGNGPNFMVKTIAEKNNVRMPSFFGYMLYSGAVMLPLSIALTWLFFVR